ncbi:MAG TPA: SDR family oxidoreductase, partial [Sunxiuqinia sp.]|nr:SDR family oxidoreductase [Sunxiuqinia sp.]
DSVDIVISTIGITRQKDGLTYMDVDYQANKNLLDEAKKSGVQKFIYISVLNGEKMRHLKICEAKEKFVDELKQSGLDYVIIRPNGFFSDMAEFFAMAQKGRVYLFGNGELKSNPIHGEDLAQICVNAINGKENEILVGGPETMNQNEIAIVAFDAAGRKQKITHIPDWIRLLVIRLAKTFTGSKTYGPIEFFMTVMGMEMVAPEYGQHTLKEFYIELNNNDKMNQ